jgi:hypothetical protein
MKIKAIANRKIKLVVFVSILILLAIVFTVIFTMQKTDSSVVARIGSVPITYRELNIYFGESKNETFSEAGAGDSASFWKLKLNGKPVLQIIKDKALLKAAKDKATEIILKESGLLTDISYNKLETEWEEENKRRDDNIKNGKPVYGVKQFSLKEFLDYRNSNLLLKYYDELIYKIEKPSDEKLEKFYIEYCKSNFEFKEPDYYKIQKIEIPITKSTDIGLTVEKLKESIASYKKGISFEELMKLNNPGGESKVQIFNKESNDTDRNVNMLLLAQIQKLKPNEITDVVIMQQSITVAKLIDYKEGQLMPFAGIKKAVEKLYAMSETEKKLAKLMDDGKIQKTSIFDSITQKDIKMSE